MKTSACFLIFIVLFTLININTSKKVSRGLSSSCCQDGGNCAIFNSLSCPKGVRNQFGCQQSGLIFRNRNPGVWDVCSQ